MRRSEAMAVLAALGALPPERRRAALAPLPDAALVALAEEWWWGVHGGQIEPRAAADGGPWRVWAIVAGRGFGKTRAGAEWVWARVREAKATGAGAGAGAGAGGGLRIALVAATLDEAARVMVEGESGLIATARSGEAPRWLRSRGLVRFPGGSEAFVYSAERPGALRGPQHHFAWADELAKWPAAAEGGERSRGEEAWDNLMLGLRLGRRPRTIVTTTPQTVPLLTRVLATPRCVRTGGRTDENPHLPADFVEAVTGLYAGTRLGRQELEGLILGDVPGALFTRATLEKARGARLRPAEEWVRVVVGVDPPASAQGDSCGIVVCAMAADGVARVLADRTVSGLRPEGWAARVAATAADWGAQKVVAEKNQGGDMVESVLRAAAFGLPVKLVAATTGKAARAEPIALHFETGRAGLAGAFPELEDQLCGLTYRGYRGPGPSPDRADAMVWAMTELFAAAPAPRVRRL